MRSQFNKPPVYSVSEVQKIISKSIARNGEAVPCLTIEQEKFVLLTNERLMRFRDKTFFSPEEQKMLGGIDLVLKADGYYE